MCCVPLQGAMLPVLPSPDQDQIVDVVGNSSSSASFSSLITSSREARERGGEAATSTPRSRYDASLLVSSSTSAFQPVFPNTGGYPLSRDSSLGEANMSRDSSLDRTR